MTWRQPGGDRWTILHT